MIPFSRSAPGGTVRQKTAEFSLFPKKTEKRVLTTAKESAKITIKFNKCFLKGCDEDGQELKFTESQWLV